MKQMFTLLFCFVLTLAQAQDPGRNRPQWQVWNHGNSILPDDSVLCVAFDSSDVKWIATPQGMYSFGSGEWNAFTTSGSGIPGDIVRWIQVDHDQSKWVGTWYHGIGKLQGNSWTIYNYSTGITTVETTNKIIPGPGITKYVATSWGMCFYDGTTWTLNGPPVSSGIKWLYDISLDISGNPWMATFWDGFYKFEASTWTAYNTGNSGVPADYARCVTPAPDGTVWMGSAGLTVFNGLTWITYTSSNSPLPGNNVYCISIDASGNKWIGTERGLAKFDGSSWTIYNTHNSGLPDSIINCISFDRYGNLWIGAGSNLVEFNENGIVSGMRSSSEQAGLAVSLNPNPVKDMAIFRISGNSRNYTLSIYNVCGQYLLTVQSESAANLMRVNTSGLLPGLYFYRLETQDQKGACGRFIKE
jgi:ligand-binding sensor domain-containing protein